MLDILVGLLLLLLAGAVALGGALLTLALIRQHRAEAEAPPLGDRVSVPTPYGDGTLHALVKGAPRPDRRPIVLIHGAGGTMRHFTQTLVAPLAETDQVIAVDRPGAGYSVAPAHETMSLSGQADFIRRGLDALGIEKPVLVGHSFGGSVALAFALEHPDDVSALVLLAPGAYPFKPKPPARADTVDSETMRRLLAYTIAPPMLEKLRPAVLEATFGPQLPPDDFLTEGGGVLTLRPSQLRAFMEEQALYQAGLRMQSTRYAELTLPITILFGEEDRIVDADAQAVPLAEAAASAAIQRFPGVGHMLPYAVPNDCLEAIRAAAAKA